VAPLVRTGGSRHTGLAAPPHRNIHPSCMQHSYLLSIDFKITSLTDWIVQLKIYPLSLSAKLEEK